MVICELHFEPKHLHITKTGIRLSKDAVPTIFEAKPLALPIVQQPTLSSQQAVIPKVSIECKNVEFIPPKPQLTNSCNRCVQQDVAIQALKAEVAKLQTTCTERLCIIQGLRKEMRKLKGLEESEPETISLQQNEKTSKKLHFECFICKTKFDSFKETRRHVIENHRPNVKCPVCKHQFTSLELEVHTCTGLESLNCTYCQRDFMSTKSLLKHLNDCNKSEQLAYKCDWCRDYFFMESLLAAHMKNHGVNKNEFACNICSKSYATKKSLSKHKMRHIDNEEKYLCDECGKGPFRNRISLTHHKLLHDSKILKCEKCGKSFSNKLALSKHVRNIHRDLKTICNICGEKFRSLKTLYVHRSK